MTVFIICSAFYYMYSVGLIGGRLSSMGIYDDNSASVRLAAFTIFDYYNLSDFITGISYNDLQILKYRTGLFAIENFWLNWLFFLWFNIYNWIHTFLHTTNKKKYFKRKGNS